MIVETLEDGRIFVDLSNIDYESLDNLDVARVARLFNCKCRKCSPFIEGDRCWYITPKAPYHIASVEIMSNGIKTVLNELLSTMNHVDRLESAL